MKKCYHFSWIDFEEKWFDYEEKWFDFEEKWFDFEVLNIPGGLDVPIYLSFCQMESFLSGHFLGGTRLSCTHSQF